MNAIAAVLMLIVAIVSLIAMQIIISRKRNSRGGPTHHNTNGVMGDPGLRGQEE